MEDHASANSDNFTSFPIWIFKNFFFSLIAVARTSKTMLNSSGENGNPCFIPKDPDQVSTLYPSPIAPNLVLLSLISLIIWLCVGH